MNGERYSVNPAAESTLNVLAVFLNIVGILAAFVYFFAMINTLNGTYDILNYSNELMYGAEESVQMGVPFYLYVLHVLAAILIYVFVGLLPWAGIKVVVNMSRSLMNVSDDVEEIKEKLASTHEQPTL